jgi:putative tricarboxylic transport membrane protein
MEALLEVCRLLGDYQIWLISVCGAVIGIGLGVLPGVGSAVGVALLTPFTLHWEAPHALAFLGVLYPSIIYGGSITAILFNIPGHGGSAATMLDGFPLTRQGRAPLALGIGAAASFLGGLAGLAALMLFSPPLARLGVSFGPAEIFLIALMGLTLVATVIRGSTVKGLISALVGLLLSTVGVNVVTGEARFTFGLLYLEDGIPFVQAVIGLFAVSQMIEMATLRQRAVRPQRLEGSLFEGALLTLRRPRTLLRSSLIGTVVGVLPGVGIVAASFLAYSDAVRASGHPERFGKGEPDGVIAPEAANSACIIGDLIPTITLGIPGGAAMAVFLGAMTMHGVRPGSLNAAQNDPAISALCAGLLIALLVILVLGMTVAPLVARIAETPRQILAPAMLLVSLAGSYILRHMPADVVLTAGFGLLGYLMKRNGFSPVPMVLGLVLGPLAEQGFQRALLISDGGYGIFFHSTAAKVLWVLLVGAAILPRLLRRPRGVPSSGSALQ